MIEIPCGDYRTIILTVQVHRILLHREKYGKDSVRVIPEYFNKKIKEKKNSDFVPLEGKTFSGTIVRPPTPSRVLG